MVVNLEINPVRIKIGDPKNGGTGSSIKLCFLIKFKFESDKALVSLVQAPGLGDGILCSGTGNQLADMSRCSLNPPEKASLTSRSLKAQTADPPMELGGVLNVAYKMASLVFASSLTLFSMEP